MIIRDVEITDAKALLDIYSHYVKNTAVSFEYEVPGVEEFSERIRKTKEKYPYIAAVEDGKIIGYCYAGVFHARKAYSWDVEISIYVDKELRKQGVGRSLYNAIEERLRVQGIKNVYSCIAYTEVEDEYLTNDSVKFHEKMGFKRCGHFHECGLKFGRWYDMVYYEKIIEG